MSKNYSKIKTWYDDGIWTKNMVRNAVKKGQITEEEYQEIIKESYKVDK